jgi:hypothetical protein
MSQSASRKVESGTDNPLKTWLDGSRVRVLPGSVHEGREAVVRRLYRPNGEPDWFLPHCLRIVFEEAVGNSLTSYIRPKGLELLELGTEVPPLIRAKCRAKQVKNSRSNDTRPAPRQAGLFG